MTLYCLLQSSGSSIQDVWLLMVTTGTPLGRSLTILINFSQFRKETLVVKPYKEKKNSSAPVGLSWEGRPISWFSLYPGVNSLIRTRRPWGRV